MYNSSNASSRDLAGHHSKHQTELPVSFPAEFPVEFSEEFPSGIPTGAPADTAASTAISPLAIASIPCQSFGSLYEDEHALQVGTVFPELDMPFFAGGDPNGR